VHNILEGLPVERMMRSNALTCSADCSVSPLVHEHIADLNLPDMRGLEFVRWVVHTLPKIKVIVLSDYDSPRYYDVCSREGAVACISKDAMALELIMTIRKALGEGI
jgi:DNA-binding NarL/FixJ family response regulator